MKAIFLMADSFRRDHTGAYGNQWIHTPNLDRLAAMSNVFDHCYAGSFPTMPNRRDIHLGKGDKDQTFNHWRPIDADETTLAERLANNKVHTMMITDVANGVTRGANAFKGFSAYTVNRGQEGDAHYPDDSVPYDLPIPPRLLRYGAGTWKRILDNRSRRRVEEDYFAPQTYKIACEWIERNWRRDNFFLWVECFDPHEPWDPPAWYAEMYDPGYKGRVLEAPPYGFYREMGIADREIKNLAARYAGEVTMVDNCVGRLLNTLEKTGLLNDVAIVFTSDHGIYAGYEGDAGAVCKPWCVGKDNGGWLFAGEHGFQGGPRWFPMRTGTMRIPLFIHLPGQRKSKRFSQIAQPWDLAPTVMDLYGLKAPDYFFGQSLLPVIQRGKLRGPRPYAFNGSEHKPIVQRQAMNKDWIYACWSQEAREPWLIDLKRDPKQLKNSARKYPEVCRAMRAALEKFCPEAASF